MKGIVEAITIKGTGGVRVSGVWFNGTQDTLETVKRLKKGAVVDFEITKDKYITKFNSIDMPITPAQDDILKEVDKQGAIMAACKATTDLIFTSDPKYKDSMGQHCNTLYIQVCKVLQ